MNNEIDNKVKEIFASAPSGGVTDEPDVSDKTVEPILTITGVCMLGIMEYYVTADDVMITSDSVSIGPDDFDQLIAELNEVRRKQRELKGGAD